MTVSRGSEVRRDAVVPSPRRPPPGETGGSPNRYVIQQYDEASLRFDLRLEVDGELLSWSVPLGPSVDPDERRLAIEMEARPLEDVDRAGQVIWDVGDYENRTAVDGRRLPIREALAAGRLRVRLVGERLQGCYELVHHARRGQLRTWLLTRIEEPDLG